MPILFGILTALVLSASAFITWKNHKAYETQIEERKKKEKNYEIREGVEKARDASIAVLVDENTNLVKEIAKLDEEIAAQTAKIDEKTAEVKTKNDKLDRLEKDVEEKDAKLASLGNVKTFVPKIKALVINIKELEGSIKEEEAKLSNLKQDKENTTTEIARNQERLSHETEGTSQPYLNSSIKTVYHTWGFVSLNGGDVQGVVPDSILDVVRDGEVVAKLKVTTVEANRAAADIVKDSLKEGVKLRSGDKVKAEEVKVEVPAGDAPAPTGGVLPTIPADEPAAEEPQP